jgi:hypothetical protein
MTIGTNLPTPPKTLTIKHQKEKVLFDYIFCGPSKNHPLPEAGTEKCQKPSSRVCVYVKKKKGIHG